jgi:uncharacterized damage-inducible protein DinB
MVEQKLPKLTTRVRFPSPAPIKSLLDHRTRLDGIVTALGAELSEADLIHTLTYQNSRGVFRKHFGSLLLHFFNHQTHHRGQASTLLSQAGIDIGVTDLLELISEQKDDELRSP